MTPNTKTPAPVGQASQANGPISTAKDEMRNATANVLSIASGRKQFSWEAPEVHFERVTPGTYDAIAVNHQGPERCRRYSRWSLRIGFQLLAEPVEISMYLNFGTGAKPVITRHGRFFEAWCTVNCDVPRLDQRMTPDIFLEPGLIFTVLVVDAAISAERLQKPEDKIYSRVEKILKVAHS